jgi:hypothetical protein
MGGAPQLWPYALDALAVILALAIIIGAALYVGLFNKTQDTPPKKGGFAGPHGSVTLDRVATAIPQDSGYRSYYTHGGR